MNNLMQNEIKIEYLVYEIRGVEVMLDSDLAMLYEVETKELMKPIVGTLISFLKEYHGN